MEESELVHILSPFRSRSSTRPAKRSQLILGYEHRFEAYVPQGQARLFRLFCLFPGNLAGDEIVGGH